MTDDIIRSAADIAAERAAQLSEDTGEQKWESSDDGSTASNGANVLDVLGLRQKLASLGEEVESLKDKNIRLVAEFDNFRKRNAREALEMTETARGRAFLEFFPVVDNLERAFIDPLTGQPVAEDWVPSDASSFVRGIRLIRDQVRKILADAGLEEVECLGNPFDPNLHDALTQMPHPDVPADHVSQVHAKGWRKGDKVLRHAQVIVSTGPAA